MSDFFDLQVDAIKTIGAETTSSQTSSRKSNTAKMLEFWVDVTATSGTGINMDLIFETSVDDTTFEEQASLLGINGTTFETITISRPTEALGTTVRVRWVITGTTPSFTFKVDMGRQE